MPDPSPSSNFKSELPRNRARPNAYGVGKYGTGKYSETDSTRYAWTRVKAALSIIILAASIGAMLKSAFAEDTYTTNLNLRKPDVDVEDTTTPWGTKINNNFDLIDAALAPGFVDTADIGADAVTAIKIINAAIQSAKLAPDAVTALAILNGAIQSAKIATDAVTVTAILNAAVQTSKLGTDSVTVSKIRNASVETSKLAPDSVTVSAILNGSISPSKLQSDQTYVAAGFTADLTQNGTTALRVRNLSTGSGALASLRLNNDFGDETAISLTGANFVVPALARKLIISPASGANQIMLGTGTIPTARLLCLDANRELGGCLNSSLDSALTVIGTSVTANAFFGNGSALTGLSSAEGNTFTSSKTFTSDVLGKSSITASAFFGDGSNLTGISAGESNTFTSSKTFTSDVLMRGGVRVATGGIDPSLFVSSTSGNVGINTANPQSSLDVRNSPLGQLSLTGVRTAGGGGGTTSRIAFKNNPTGSTFLQLASIEGDVAAGSIDSGKIRFYTVIGPGTSNEQMHINEKGMISIGQPNQATGTLSPGDNTNYRVNLLAGVKSSSGPVLLDGSGTSLTVLGPAKVSSNSVTVDGTGAALNVNTPASLNVTGQTNLQHTKLSSTTFTIDGIGSGFFISTGMTTGIPIYAITGITQVINWGATAATTCDTQNVALLSATLGRDSCIVSAEVDVEDAGCILRVKVSQTSQVVVKRCNVGLVACANPAAATHYITCFKQ